MIVDRTHQFVELKGQISKLCI
uniref:Uncharacterized protein n=1 Tax=Arundo donax TaxID=35708 RepID=A0A0A9FXU7_ARUDO